MGPQILGEDDFLLLRVFLHKIDQSLPLGDLLKLVNPSDNPFSVASVRGHLKEILLQGKWTASGFSKKVVNRQPVEIFPSQKIVQSSINLPFDLCRLHPQRGGKPPGELQIDGASCVSDHDITKQLPQRVPAGRSFETPFLQIFLLEKLLRFELPRFQEGDEIEEFDEIVLERRSREEKDESLLDLVDELPCLGGPVPQMMGLIDHDKVIKLPRYEREILLVLRRVEGGNEVLLFPEHLRVFVPRHFLGSLKREVEFRL